MGSYQVAPCIGHLERLKKMYGYIKPNPDSTIHFRNNIPDHECYNQIQHYDWSSTVYGHGSEELPSDMPIPRGHKVRTTNYHDANLFHDLATGQSIYPNNAPCEPNTYPVVLQEEKYCQNH
jgi:hypothetical protein